MEVSLHPGTFIFMILNFVLLVIVLARLLYRPLQGMLEQRKQKIATDLNAAEKSRADWEKAQREAKEALEKAQAEAFALMEKARGEADQVRETLINQARNEAEQIRQRTQAEIERAKRAAQDELREGAVSLALTAAAKAIGGKMSQDINESLIHNVLDSLEKGAG